MANKVEFFGKQRLTSLLNKLSQKFKKTDDKIASNTEAVEEINTNIDLLNQKNETISRSVEEIKKHIGSQAIIKYYRRAGDFDWHNFIEIIPNTVYTKCCYLIINLSIYEIILKIDVSESHSQIECIYTNNVPIVCNHIKYYDENHSIKIAANLTSGWYYIGDTDRDFIFEAVEDIETYQNIQVTNIQNFDKTEINQIKTEVDNLTGYIGYSDDILGVEVDFENNKFSRLSAAVGLTGGTDFDKFNMYGGRKRCNVSDNGEITVYYGDDNFKEDGSNGQVMVYQPKFYYKVVPLKLEPINGGKDGYSIRKARWYVSDTPQEGFKLHPAFIERGNENDYILLSAYEGCLYDNGDYILDDSATTDFDTAKLSSIANAKPVSGANNALTRANARKLAHNRGKGWEQCYAATVSASQLLMLVEYASFDMQKNIGSGNVSKADDRTTNLAENTGATSTLGNKSGVATNGNDIQFISYRGEENFWGNMNAAVDGMNVENPADWDNTNEVWKFTGQHGKLYVANYDFADDTKEKPYVDTGICPVYGNAYVSAFGYNNNFDWLFIPTEIGGTNNFPVSDKFWNLNKNFRTVMHGGNWYGGSGNGAFYISINYGSVSTSRNYGSRLVYIPSKTLESEVQE